MNKNKLMKEIMEMKSKGYDRDKILGILFGEYGASALETINKKLDEAFPVTNKESFNTDDRENRSTNINYESPMEKVKSAAEESNYFSKKTAGEEVNKIAINEKHTDIWPERESSYSEDTVNKTDEERIIIRDEPGNDSPEISDDRDNEFQDIRINEKTEELWGKKKESIPSDMSELSQPEKPNKTTVPEYKKPKSNKRKILSLSIIGLFVVFIIVLVTNSLAAQEKEKARYSLMALDMQSLKSAVIMYAVMNEDETNVSVYDLYKENLISVDLSLEYSFRYYMDKAYITRIWKEKWNENLAKEKGLELDNGNLCLAFENPFKYNIEKNRKYLGVSYSQAINKLTMFKMEKDFLNDGTERYFGRYNNALLEFVGSKNNLQMASVQLVMLGDDSSIEENLLISYAFFKNFISDDSKNTILTEFVNNLTKTATDGKDISYTIQGKKIEISFLKEIGSLFISISPA